MLRNVSMRACIGLPVWFLVLCVGTAARAQRPQDNWYAENTWTKTGTGFAATNGGLSAPYGVAVSSDGRVYIGDEGYSRIQVYRPDGSFVFSITNGFGGGKSFSKPRGMIFDRNGYLYVADSGRQAVFVFFKDGAFVRQIGGVSGAGAGEMSSPVDVGVSRSGDVFVLDAGNRRVSVFASDGTFLRAWGGQGTLTSQFDGPKGLAVAPDGRVFVCQVGTQNNPGWNNVKIFTADGIYISYFVATVVSENIQRSPCSIRFQPDGLLHVAVNTGNAGANWEFSDYNSYGMLFSSAGANLQNLGFCFGASYVNGAYSPVYSAAAPDGMIYVLNKTTRTWITFRQVLRELWQPPHNAIPMPCILGTQQRPNSALVDIDYQVTDMDDTNVYAAAMVFMNGSQSISNCIRNLTLTEGTATNIGPGIAANKSHRLTWNAGADWGINLGNYRVAILARDSRPNLLDIHYLHLPAGNGKPALTISRSPLIANDYMQVWWWLLATGDAGIGLSGQRIMGVGGAYDGQILCDNGTTTPNGRAYVYQKMNVREATADEVDWARQGALPGNINRWSSAGVSGRPAKVNEYGFDTGASWGTSAFWVVPLD